MPADLSKLSTEDLQALKAGNLSKVSTAGLQSLRGAQPPAPPGVPPTPSDGAPEGNWRDTAALATNPINLAGALALGAPVDFAADVWDLAGLAEIAIKDPIGLATGTPRLKEGEFDPPLRRETITGSSQNIKNAMHQHGVLRPGGDATSPAGRVLQSAATAGVLGLAGRAPSVGSLLRNVGGSAAAGAAGQTAAEAGIGPGGQVLASMLPGHAANLSPQVREAIRRQLTAGADVRGNVARDREAGIANPDPAAAAQSRTLAGVQAALGRLPGGGGIMDEAAARRAQGLSGRLREIQGDLAPGGPPTREQVGTALQGMAERRLATSKSIEDMTYRRVDRFVPQTTPITLSRTLAAMDKISGRTAGLSATSSAIGGDSSSRVAKAAAELRNARGPAPFKGVGGPQPAQGVVPYSAVQALRSRLGAQFTGGPAWEGLSAGDARTLYAAMSDDIRDSLPTPEARKSWEQATALSRDLHEHYRDVLRPLIDKINPEAAVQSAMSGTKQGASQFRKTIGGLKPAEAKELAALTIEEMGKAPSGQQNAGGDAFSPATFFRRWHDMHEDAKAALFPAGTRKDLDAVVAAVDRMNQYSRGTLNTSGTARAVTQAGFAGGVATAVLDRILSGSPGGAVAVAAGAGAQVLGTRAVARAMTSPEFVHWLAEGTKVKDADARLWAARLATIATQTRDPQTRQAILEINDQLQGQPDAQAPQASGVPQP